jgi:hypothetical protein
MRELQVGFRPFTAEVFALSTQCRQPIFLLIKLVSVSLQQSFLFGAAF